MSKNPVRQEVLIWVTATIRAFQHELLMGRPFPPSSLFMKTNLYDREMEKRISRHEERKVEIGSNIKDRKNEEHLKQLSGLKVTLICKDTIISWWAGAAEWCGTTRSSITTNQNEKCQNKSLHVCLSRPINRILNTSLIPEGNSLKLNMKMKTRRQVLFPTGKSFIKVNGFAVSTVTYLHYVNSWHEH